jgi:hypothetical protein
MCWAGVAAPPGTQQRESRDQQQEGARKVAKKNSGPGTIGDLTLKQTDKLAHRLKVGADRVAERGDSKSLQTAMEIYDVTKDLHESWMDRFDRGER